MLAKKMNDDEILMLLSEEAKKNGATDSDVLLSKNTGLAITCRNGVEEKIEQYDNYNIGIRVFLGKKNAILSTNHTSKIKLRELVAKAIDMAKIVPEDEFSMIASKKLHEEKPVLTNINLETFDSDFPNLSCLKEKSLKLETNALEISKLLKSDGSQASWNLTETSMLTSNGFLGKNKRTSNSLSIVLVGEKENKKERDYDFSTKVFFNDLEDTKIIANNAAEKVLKKLGSKKPKTGHFPVIFNPRTAKSLLGHISSAINGNAIVRGTSFLKNSLNKKVFSENLNVIDDPSIKRGLGSRLFDAEGIGTRKLNLVSNGFIKNFLLDISSSSKLKINTNGNAVRSINSSPSPGSSNLIILPGDLEPEALINSIDEGFLVTELIGSSVSILTGDYSRGAGGFWIKNGKITHPVSEATIAGNLKDIFKNIIPANDLDHSSSIISPSLMVQNMVIAGS